MDATDILDVGREAIFLLLKVSLPILLAALFTGLIISLFQALTQIQEMTLTFVPKILIVLIALIVSLPYISSGLDLFTMGIFNQIQKI